LPFSKLIDLKRIKYFGGFNRSILIKNFCNFLLKTGFFYIQHRDHTTTLAICRVSQSVWVLRRGVPIQGLPIRILIVLLSFGEKENSQGFLKFPKDMKEQMMASVDFCNILL